MNTKGKQVTIKDLRNFGLIVGGIFGLIAFWPLVVRGQQIRIWAISVSVALLVPAIVAPSTLEPVHRVWMKVGHVLGWINTRILLGIVFYGIVTPIGFFARLFGKDSMTLHVKEPVESYRRPKEPRPATHMWHPF